MIYYHNGKNTSTNTPKLIHIVLHIKVCVVKYKELIVDCVYEKGECFK